MPKKVGNIMLPLPFTMPIQLFSHWILTPSENVIVHCEHTLSADQTPYRFPQWLANQSLEMKQLFTVCRNEQKNTMVHQLPELL